MFQVLIPFSKPFVGRDAWGLLPTGKHGSYFRDRSCDCVVIGPPDEGSRKTPETRPPGPYDSERVKCTYTEETLRRILHEIKDWVH